MGGSFYIRSEAQMSNCQYMMQVKSTEDAKICFSISFEDHVSAGIMLAVSESGLFFF